MRMTAIVTAPPSNWKTTKVGTEAGAMPAKVSEKIRPTLIAGLAKLVAGEEVGGADVGADRGRSEATPPGSCQREDQQQQAEGRHHLGEQVRW
jgi:hypothetical protein